jgi:hypothetical protein
VVVIREIIEFQPLTSSSYLNTYDSGKSHIKRGYYSNASINPLLTVPLGPTIDWLDDLGAPSYQGVQDGREFRAMSAS